MKKALIVLSGGQDSITCLYWAKQQYTEVEAIIFDYSQRHKTEIGCAVKVCNLEDVLYKVVDLGFFSSISKSALTDDRIGVADKVPGSDLPATFTPNRNALFLTIAHAYAQQIGAQHVVTGVCQTDYSGYPDCRREFIGTIEHALNLGSGRSIQIETPLMWRTKAETFELADELGVLNKVVEHSHTCYNGNRTQRHDWGYGCGTCPACELRKKGFEEYIAFTRAF